MLTPKQEAPNKEIEKEMSHTLVDRKSLDIMLALSEAPIYRKKGTVIARLAEAGEKVSTILADGTLETVNTAKDGDWVVTNPSGEKHILNGKVFSIRYAETDEPGVFQAIGHCRAVRNPFGRPIEIMGSWGSLQRGGKDCFFADICDRNGNDMGGEPYLIEANAFAETYERV